VLKLKRLAAITKTVVHWTKLNIHKEYFKIVHHVDAQYYIDVNGDCLAGKCTDEHLPDACLHEYHIFGTNDVTAASLRLTLLIAILLFNVSGKYGCLPEAEVLVFSRCPSLLFTNTS
jgi:hypothetical protein